MNTKDDGGKVVNRGAGPASPVDAGETIAASHLAGDGEVAAGTTHAKVCCMCGTNVANEKRYKDAAGRYWCCDCAKADSTQKPSATCPACGRAFAPSDLDDYEGNRLCGDCGAKRQRAVKREAARLAAAAEEARLQKVKYRWTLILVGVVVGLVVLYAVIRVVRG